MATKKLVSASMLISVTLGACLVDVVPMEEGSGAALRSQNDMGTGMDAAGTWSAATEPAFLDGTGRLEPGDTDDYYAVHPAPGDRVVVTMTPPTNGRNDFDLELLGPDGAVLASSAHPGGAESVDAVRGVLTSGPWAQPCDSGVFTVRVHRTIGKGVYTLSIEPTSAIIDLADFQTLTVDTCTGEDRLTDSGPVNGIGACSSEGRPEVVFRIVGAWSNAHVVVAGGHLTWVDEVGRGLSPGGAGYAECGAEVACGNNWSNTGANLLLAAESDAAEGCGEVTVSFDSGVRY